MRTTIAILCLLGLALWGCQPATAPAGYELPGTAAFLQQDDSLALSAVAAMGLEDKLRQLLVLRISEADLALQPAAYAEYGGYELHGLALSEWQKWQQQADANKPFPLLKSTPVAEWPANYLSGMATMPCLASAQAVQDDAIRQHLKSTYAEQLLALGLNVSYWVNPALASLNAQLSQAEENNLASTIKQWTSERLLTVIGPFAASGLLVKDTTLAYRQRLAALEASIAAGLSGLHLSPDLIANSESSLQVQEFFRQHLQFGGLLLARVEDRAQMDDWLAADVDAFIVRPAQADAMLGFLRAAYRGGDLSEGRLNDKVRRLLLARQWAKQREWPKSMDERPSLEAAVFKAKSEQDNPPLGLSAYLESPDWRYWQEQLTASSLVLAANPGQRLPIAGGTPLALYEQPEVPWPTAMRQTLDRYIAVRDISSLRALQEEETLVAVLRGTRLDSALAQQLLKRASQQAVVVVNLGRPENLALLDTSVAVVQAFESGALAQSYAAQLVMGGLSASGRLPATYGKQFRAGQGEDTEAVRLGYGSAYQVGVAPQRLVGIDAIVESAIDEKAFPGAQVLVAKNGKVVYRKAFGYHTYGQEQPVRIQDYYDLASITKVAATTLVAMQAYEAETIALNDRLREHLQLDRSSRLRNLRVKELLSHRTGLQPHLPVIPYLLERDMDNANCEHYFCESPSADFPVAVSGHFYFARKYHDRIWKDMQRLRSRYTRYRYSDVNFVLLQRLLETKAGMRLDSLAAQSFYQPLGLRRLKFLPLQTVPLAHIIPTEADQRWRHQLVHGYVHDETAALLGGVAGHAGLFGNADDLAVLFQMLLNGGTYGNRRFFNTKTIEKFTTAAYGNHRGLGFDKPKPAEIGQRAFPEGLSKATFGHTGFTGACVWSDPEQQLTYIFLSNRIHPDRDNQKLFTLRVRERVHEVIYDALGTYEAGWPQMAAAQGGG